MTNLDLTDGHEDKMCQCDNCDWVGKVSEAKPEIVDIQERLTAGGVVPVAECPECCGLCYLLGDDQQ